MDAAGVISQAESGSLGVAYVLVGTEHVLVERVVRALDAAVRAQDPAGLNVAHLNAAEVTGAEVTSRASTSPMFAARRLLLVRHVDAWPVADLDAMAAYLESPCAWTTLALVADKLDGRSRLAKLAKQQGVLVELSAPRGVQGFRAFVTVEMTRRGLRVGAEVADAMVLRVGQDVGALAEACERLALYVGDGGRVSMEAVEACVATQDTDTVWAMVDGISEGDRSQVMRSLASLLGQREAPLKLLSMMTRQLRMLVQMRQALGEGLRPAEAAQRAGVPPFKADALARAAKRVSEGQLGRALTRLAEADRALKGSRVPSERVIELAALELFGEA